jgi:hypothetical protein
LGFPCYHMHEVINNETNKSHVNFWLQVANGNPGQQFDWEQVFANYTATVDNPGFCVWEELWQSYPDAKILLTLHPKGAEAWYESTMNTIYFTEKMWQFKLLELLTPFGRKFGQMTHKLIWQRSHKNTMEDREKALAHYQQHSEEVKAKVPADKLLVFTVDQGWEPLCRFLGVDVPSIPFPNVNDREQFQKTKKDITKGAYVFVGLGALLLGVLAYGVMKWLG